MKMPNRSGVKAVESSLEGLFKTSAATKTLRMHPDYYCRQAYVKKNLYGGIEFLARVHGTSECK